MPLYQSGPVLVVIVNYRTAELVVACLRSLQAEIAAHPGCTVTVVDNASADRSAETIRAAFDAHGWGGWACVVALPVNGGFAAGNNVAIRAALAQVPRPAYIWLVNPDTLVRSGALSALLAFMDGHPRAGIAGGSLESEHGEHWPYAFRFPSLSSEIDGGLRLGVVSRWLARYLVPRLMGREPERVDWISGANFMVRTALIETINLMYEGLFMYFDFVRHSSLVSFDRRDRYVATRAAFGAH